MILKEKSEISTMEVVLEVTMLYSDSFCTQGSSNSYKTSVYWFYLSYDLLD